MEKHPIRPGIGLSVPLSYLDICNLESGEGSTLLIDRQK